jgi:large subunit ribosomal protein L21
MAKTTDTYAVISVGGKQYRVREGERLLVDRIAVDEGKTFHPDLLLLGGDGEAKLGESELKGSQVTARVAAHVLGKKVIVGKHRRRTGYRRRNGHRSRLSQIEIQAIGKKATRASAAAKPATAKPDAPKPRAAKKPAAPKKTAAPRKTAARKPAARSKKSEEKK